MNIDVIARNAYRCARMPASMEAYTGVTMRQQSADEGHKPTDASSEWMVLSGRPRPDTRRSRIKAYLREHGPACRQVIGDALELSYNGISTTVSRMIKRGEIYVVKERDVRAGTTAVYMVTE